MKELLHDIRNLVTAARSFLEVAGIKMNSKDPAKPYILKALKVIDNLHQILSEACGKEILDINKEVSDVRDTFALIAKGRKIRIVSHIDDLSVPAVVGDLLAFRRSLQNVVLNAIEAARTEVRIRTGVWFEPNDFPRTVIAVMDDGGGIPPADLLRIFDYGWSTKSSKGDHGVGLAYLKEAAPRFGRIALKTSKQGTTFFLVLGTSKDLVDNQGCREACSEG